MTDDGDGTIAGRSPRLYQRALEVIASEIRGGRWQDAARLNETTVAARFGISRAPARQALVELELSGLVRKSEGRGYQVVADREANAAANHVDAPESSADGDDMRLHFLASWELIYHQVEMDIVSRTSIASWRVNEAALAKSFGVSRTVAREVVARLQQRGIVSKDDGGRWHAPALTATHVNQLYELRWTLEPLALEQAVPRLPAGLLPQLLADLQVAIAAGEGADVEMLDKVEQQLHGQLLGHCANLPLMQAISLPQAILVAHHRLYQPKAPSIADEPFLLEHLVVFECLMAGRIGEAQEALSRHLRISQERAMLRIARTARSLALPDVPYLERLRDVEFS
ncbi:DNA-binding transcriptional regulator, GntR family [Rhizobium sp. NFR07]|uniref:GntR family transcriptional regulator n=1 Tax=Rhizobium sp. NFR07 TaxID=1566262 RepID=UPI0008E3635E|nr:GntR family transcriptional regulator [Rhizobium sp. NFR07]SFB33435.1 DNA-binding transcriptional regulator, GntR family [Rhizobium sp. NFR07]